MKSKAIDEISLKEVFERLVILETKFDESLKVNEKTTKKFTMWAIIITVLELLNLWVHSLTIGH